MIIVEKDFSKYMGKIAASNGIDLSDNVGSNPSLETLYEALKDLNKQSDVIDAKSKVSVKDIRAEDKFYGTITTTIKDRITGKKVRTQITSTFKMLDNKKNTDSVTVQDLTDDKIYKTSRKGTQLRSMKENIEQQIARKKLEEEIKKLEEEKKCMDKFGIEFNTADTPTRIKRTIEAGIKNIWLCGPAGSGNKRY